MATRFGRQPERAAARKEVPSEGNEIGSSGSSPTMASKSSARSSTLRAIGPSTPRVESILLKTLAATRPGEGRMPDHAAEARRIAQRTAEVRAMRHPGHAGGQRHCSTAGRPRRRHPCVPGIERRPEDLVEGIGAGAELRRVRHRIDDAALAFEMGDEHIGCGRDTILVNGRALRRAHARHVGQVLDRHRKARQHAALAQRLGHQPTRMLARPVEAERRQRIDHAVNGGNARFQRVDAIQRRN